MELIGHDYDEKLRENRELRSERTFPEVRVMALRPAFDINRARS